ncbi:hypothetical protein ACQV5M_15210 [Leptospira sp. SA-E8]|uniref:hypothetical protein n=1 Tax=Leptospira sp. SA-E8 TaxID=3422259 RepID=UPI003EB9D663
MIVDNILLNYYSGIMLFELGSFSEEIHFYIGKLGKLNHHAARLYNTVKDELEEFKREVADDLRKATSSEERDWIYEMNENDYLSLSDMIPRIIFEGIFLKSYFLYEHYISLICDKIFDDYSAKSKIILKQRDLSGKGVQRSINYLTKVWGISLPNYNHQRIEDINYIRNCLAHNDGKLVGNSKISSPDEKLIVDNGDIEVSYEYVLSANNYFMAILSNIAFDLNSKGIK